MATTKPVWNPYDPPASVKALEAWNAAEKATAVTAPVATPAPVVTPTTVATPTPVVAPAVATPEPVAPVATTTPATGLLSADLSNIYSTELGRTGEYDPTGTAYWQSQLDSGVSLADVQRMINESPEGVVYDNTPKEVEGVIPEPVSSTTAPTYTPSAYIPTSIATGTSYMTPGTSVEDRITDMTTEGSEYLQSAANRAQEAASSTGMLGSTIEQEAIERARIDAALPIAQADAAMEGLFQQQQQAAETAATRDLWQNEYDYTKELVVQEYNQGTIDKNIAANLEQTIVQMDAENIRSFNDNFTKLSQQFSSDKASINAIANNIMNDDEKASALADLQDAYNNSIENLTAGYNAGMTGDFSWDSGISVEAGGEPTTENAYDGSATSERGTISTTPTVIMTASEAQDEYNQILSTLEDYEVNLAATEDYGGDEYIYDAVNRLVELIEVFSPGLTQMDADELEEELGDDYKAKHAASSGRATTYEALASLASS